MAAETENPKENGVAESMSSNSVVNADVSERNSNPTRRRSPDDPSELNFEEKPETDEERLKRQKIEIALKDSSSTITTWQGFAISEYGLINDDLRRRVWPLLLGVDPAKCSPVPSLEDLKGHPEYQQVVLDVNRSLKRFPPSISYEQRLALQDQLTVLILRVITKYPHLSYYQGYHDVAVTCLLVVGDRVAFHMMEVLSTGHLEECMGKTMEATQRRLLYIFPLINNEHPQLCEYLERSTVGTMFALPWYLTWFGHSLPYYRTVVRLFDYFLATAPLFPLYLSAAIVIHRADAVFKEDCDMASLHCLLSNLPDDLPFEKLLKSSSELYSKYPPEDLDKYVEIIIQKEKEQRAREEAVRKERKMLQNRPLPVPVRRAAPVGRWVPLWLGGRAIRYPIKYFLVSASILIGFYAYYRSQELMSR